MEQKCMDDSLAIVICAMTFYDSFARNLCRYSVFLQTSTRFMGNLKRKSGTVAVVDTVAAAFNKHSNNC